MSRLKSVQPLVSPLGGIRQAWQKPAASPQRLSGRALMDRNARIKQRDGYRCAACGRIGETMDVDHIVPLSKGGRDCDANLQLLCRGRGLCHDQKTLADRRGG